MTRPFSHALLWCACLVWVGFFMALGALPISHPTPEPLNA